LNIERDKVIIGWIGSPQNTFYLEPLLPVFQRICEKYEQVCFSFIGSAPVEYTGVNLHLVKWELHTETFELQKFDIGIMPLPDDEWTRGKGGYKLLQYMALGIPSVAAPVGINSSLLEDGENGFLATSEQEWFDRLSYLVEHEPERKRMGAIAREKAVMEYSFDVASTRLLRSIEALLS
jgi:glycosyltransferase involved in cell wall biosynthesis